VPEPFALVRAGATEVPDDLVALGDQLHDLHAEVGERAAERVDPGRGASRHRSVGDLFEQRRVAAVDDLVDHATDELLVRLGGFGERHDTSMHPIDCSAFNRAWRFHDDLG
jgi:hypothetical protein